jgi:hypothetical protein
MKTNAEAKSGSVPHLENLPCHVWDLQRLEDYTRTQYQAIETNERSIARSYWRLGIALNLIRKSFPHDQWEAGLQKLGIDKSRAARARRIYGRYATEELLEGVTVTEALRQSRSTPGTPIGRTASRQAPPAHRHKTNYRQVMKRISREIREIGAAVDTIPASRRGRVFEAIQKMVRDLTELQEKLGPRTIAAGAQD